MCHIHDKLTLLMNWAQHGAFADMFLIVKAYTTAVMLLLNPKSYSKSCLPPTHSVSNTCLTVVYKLWLVGHSKPCSVVSLWWYCRSCSKIVTLVFFFLIRSFFCWCISMKIWEIYYWMCKDITLTQKSVNPGHDVAQVSKLSVVVLFVFYIIMSVCMVRVTLLALKIWKSILGFCKISGHFP